jgi:hypothetical protein
MPENDNEDESRSQGTGDADYEAQIAALEVETEQGVSRTMSAIESAVESWKAAGKKPPGLRLQIVTLQEFYDDLVEWEKKSLMSKKERDLDARIKRLRRYVEICSAYEKARLKRVG